MCCAFRKSRHRSISFLSGSASSKGIRATGTAGRGIRVWRCTSAPHVSRSPVFQHPPFDFEHRIVTVQLPNVTVASIYVPNGGKDFAAKMRFLEAMDQFAAESQAEGMPLVMCGDMNVARTDMDVHPKERKPGIVGQRADERALIEQHPEPRTRRRAPDASNLTTPICSPGGRRGATSSSAISAGGSTTSSRARRSPHARHRASSSANSGRATTGRSSHCST